jgi:steroid 5-alpha reductase family enzyme
MLEPLTQALIAWAALAVAMAILWAIQLRTRDASSVDAAWALGIGAVAVFFAATGPGSLGSPGEPRAWLAAGLIAAWALRLGGHLLIDRVWRAPAEDGRYAAMRAHWGATAPLNFLWFYQAQALAALAFSLPFLALAHDPRPLGLIDGLCVLWWAATLAGVWISDRQLSRWRADPATRGTTCRGGLWARSRHPNYFCEWLHWFSYVGLALGGPAGWWTLLAPAVLYLLLRYATGIPYTEARALKTRPDYADYQRTVPAFFPRLTR